MVNEFKTLLTNVDYAQSSEHIAKGYNALKLPVPLANIYNILFASAKTREDYVKIGLYYVNLVASTTFADAISKNDSRITYTLDASGSDFSTITNSEPTLLQQFDYLGVCSGILTDINKLSALLTLDGYTGVTYQPNDNKLYALASILVCYVDKVRNLI